MLRSGTLIISYASVSISFEILSWPGDLFFLSCMIASSNLEIEIMEFISSSVTVDSHGFKSSRLGASLVYSETDRSSSVSLGVSV